jgi:hypothetical protein
MPSSGDANDSSDRRAFPAAVPSNPESRVRIAIPTRNWGPDGLYPKRDTVVISSFGIRRRSDSKSPDMMTDEVAPTMKCAFLARQTATAIPIPIPAVHIRFWAK